MFVFVDQRVDRKEFAAGLILLGMHCDFYAVRQQARLNEVSACGEITACVYI